MLPISEKRRAAADVLLPTLSMLPILVMLPIPSRLYTLPMLSCDVMLANDAHEDHALPDGVLEDLFLEDREFLPLLEPLDCL